MRIAAILLPQLAIECAFELEDSARSILAVQEGPAPGRLGAVSIRAAELGLQVGMRVSAALARQPGLSLRPRDPARELERLSIAAELLYGFSAQVQPCPPDLLLAELGAGARLLGERFGGEAQVLAAIEEALGQLGHRAAFALAGDSETAQALARWVASRRLGPSAWVVPPGEDRAALSGLPLSALVFGPEAKALDSAVASLERLGVTQISGLQGEEGLSQRALGARFKGVGALLSRRARAEAGRPLTAFSPPAQLLDRVELGAAVEALGSVLFALRALFVRLEARLAARALAASMVRLVFVLEPGMHEGIDVNAHRPRSSRRRHALTLRFARPTRRAKTMLSVVREQLGQALPGAVIEVEAEALLPTAHAGAQLDLFTKRAQQLEQTGAALGRLQALFGEAAVISPRLVDTHRPEAAWRAAAFDIDRALSPPAPRARPRAQAVQPEGAAPSAAPLPSLEGLSVVGAGAPEAPDGVRASARPQPSVRGAEAKAPKRSSKGRWPKPQKPTPEPAPPLPPRPLALFEPPELTALRPGQIRWRGRWRRAQAARPERLWAEWWRAQPLIREYQLLRLEDGRRLWVFSSPEGSFVHGVFD